MWQYILVLTRIKGSNLVLTQVRTQLMSARPMLAKQLPMSFIQSSLISTQFRWKPISLPDLFISILVYPFPCNPNSSFCHLPFSYPSIHHDISISSLEYHSLILLKVIFVTSISSMILSAFLQGIRHDIIINSSLISLASPFCSPSHAS